MKKKLMITLPEDLFNYLEENFINKSALIENLIRAKYKKHTDICINIKPEEEELSKELEEVFNAGTT